MGHKKIPDFSELSVKDLAEAHLESAVAQLAVLMKSDNAQIALEASRAIVEMARPAFARGGQAPAGPDDGPGGFGGWPGGFGGWPGGFGGWPGGFGGWPGGFGGWPGGFGGWPGGFGGFGGGFRTG